MSTNAAAEIVMRTASDIQPRAVEWMWKDRIPTGLTLLVGETGAGKSLFVAYLTACITTGRDFFDGENRLRPSRVLIMSCHSDWEDMDCPRLIAADANLSMVHWVDAFDGRAICLDRDMDALEQKLATVWSNVKVLFVDCLEDFLGYRASQDACGVQVRGVMQRLRRLADRFHIAVIVTTPLKNLNAIYRTGYHGMTRASWVMTPIDGSENQEGILARSNKNFMQPGNALHYIIRDKLVQFDESEEWVVPYLDFV